MTVTNALEQRDYILRIEVDTDTENPLETMGERWRLVSFFRHKLTTDGDIAEFYTDTPDGYTPKIGLRRKLAASTAFRLDYYDHGDAFWSLSGEGMADPWDSARGAGLLLYLGKPSDLGTDAAERAANARITLQVYNEWANGACFWYSLEDAATGEIEDSCGGLIGYAYAAEAIVDYANLASIGPCRIKLAGDARDIGEMYADKFPANVTFVSDFADDGADELSADEY